MFCGNSLVVLEKLHTTTKTKKFTVRDFFFSLVTNWFFNEGNSKPTNHTNLWDNSRHFLLGRYFLQIWRDKDQILWIIIVIKMTSEWPPMSDKYFYREDCYKVKELRLDNRSAHIPGKSLNHRCHPVGVSKLVAIRFGGSSIRCVPSLGL